MSIENDQISVGTTATLIHTASALGGAGASVTIKNAGSESVFIGDSGVTTSNGYELATGDILPIDMVTNESLYGIVASGTEDVHKLVTAE